MMARWNHLPVAVVVGLLRIAVNGDENDCVCNHGNHPKDIKAVPDVNGPVLDTLIPNKCVHMYVKGPTVGSSFHTIQQGDQMAYILNTNNLRVEECHDIESTAIAGSMTHPTVTTTPVTTRTGCPHGFVPLDDGCYKFVTHRGNFKSWMDANMYCKHHHGHLLFINSKHEQRSIKHYLENNITSADNRSYWIGATDRQTEGHWQWIDPNGVNIPFQHGYSHWHPGQPNNLSGQDCVMLKEEFNFEWNDASCHDIHGFVCESTS